MARQNARSRVSGIFYPRPSANCGWEMRTIITLSGLCGAVWCGLGVYMIETADEAGDAVLGLWWGGLGLLCFCISLFLLSRRVAR
jgi:hypothetical protein